MYRATLENHFPRFANGGMALKARCARMHAADFIIIRPQCHQTLQIRARNGIVERVFHIVGSGENSNRTGHEQLIFLYRTVWPPMPLLPGLIGISVRERERRA
jgi:hypothetical protein